MALVERQSAQRTPAEAPDMPRRNAGIGLGESGRIAAANLRANPLRTLLTALGVMIGVAAVVGVLALGRGAEAKVTASITASGANLLTVRAGSLGAGGFSGDGGKTRSLTLDDAEALADPSQVPAAGLVAPEYMAFGSITRQSKQTSAMITGATPSFLPIHNHSMRSGSFLTDDQVERGASVVVLGARLAETLFGTDDPVGSSLRINGQSFKVIGVLASKGGDGFGSIDDGAVMPLTTVQRRLGMERSAGKVTVSSIVVQARNAEQIDAAMRQIAAVLRGRHELPHDGSSDDFSVDNQQDLIESLTESRRTMTLYLGAIAVIALLVGGIGIMNIMLVSVHERTREIGLRKAIGARDSDILLQFLVEALVLSAGGGLVGALLGVVTAWFVSRARDLPFAVSPDALGLALGFALAIGLIFGLEPARRAARLDPIEALRSE